MSRKMLKSARGAHHQIVFDVTHQIAFTRNCAIVASLEVEQVGEVDQRVGGLQLVIAVSATAGHMQEQIELGRGWQRERKCIAAF